MTVVLEREVDAAEVAEEPRRHKWTRTDLYRMVDAGILPEGARVELIEGEIIDMSPMSPPHATALLKARRRLERELGENHCIPSQVPLVISEETEPNPDLFVVEGEPDDYAEAHPTSALLVVEVSETTLRSDRNRKSSLYAKAGLPEYWIIDTVNRKVEVRRDPAPNPNAVFGYDYATISPAGIDETVSPLFKPEIRLRVRDLLPNPKRKP